MCNCKKKMNNAMNNIEKKKEIIKEDYLETNKWIKCDACQKISIFYSYYCVLKN